MGILPDYIVRRIVVGSDGCWLWAGRLDAKGYGAVEYQHRSWKVHRLVYSFLAGEIPMGLELDHLCRVRACVNPRHLEPVTHQENMRRSTHDWTTPHCKNGHEWTEENAWHRTRDGRTWRECRACRREAVRRSRARRTRRAES